MIYFNNLLFSSINTVFGLTQKGFSMKVYGNDFKYKQRLSCIDRLLVNDVIRLCNAMHISISHFFVLEPVKDIIQEKTYYTIGELDFKQIVFKNENIAELYGGKRLAGKLTRDEIAAKLHISNATLYLWSKNSEQIKISSLLEMCNTLHVPLKEFIEDPNRKLVEDAYSNDPNLPSEIMDEIRALRDMVSKSQKEIKRLNSVVKPDYVSSSAPAATIAEADAEFEILKKKCRICELDNEILKREIAKLKDENEALKRDLAQMNLGE